MCLTMYIFQDCKVPVTLLWWYDYVNFPLFFFFNHMNKIIADSRLRYVTKNRFLCLNIDVIIEINIVVHLE